MNDPLWEVDNDNRFDHIKDSQGNYVAVVVSSKPADAFLLAAAPLLLTTCVDTLKLLRAIDVNTIDATETLKRLEDAITEASRGGC